MVGRTPGHIMAVRPLIEGVISDFEVTEQMLRYFFNKVHKDTNNFLIRPRVVIGIPSGVTEVERRAVEDAVRNAGAREVYLVEEPMAAAIGSGMPISEAVGNMIIDIGGGTTDIAVISLGGIVVSRNLRVAGEKMDEDIIQYARDTFNLLLGERNAERLKMRIGTAIEPDEPLEIQMRGRDLLSGLPKEIMINDSQVREALQRSVRTIVENIKATLNITPPELVADIMEKGIIVSGGGAQLRYIDEFFKRMTGVETYVAEEPIFCVAKGAGIILSHLDVYKRTLLNKR